MSGNYLALILLLSFTSSVAWAQEDLDSDYLFKRSLVFYEDVKANDEEMQAIESSGGVFKLYLKGSENSYLELAKYQYENGKIENLLILNTDNRVRIHPVSVVHLKSKYVPSLWSYSTGIVLVFKFETGWGAKVKIIGNRITLEEYNE